MGRSVSQPGADDTHRLDRDNGAMPSPPAHRIIDAHVHRVPQPFLSFAVRSDEPRHAFDARSPYGQVHAVRMDAFDASSLAGLAA